MGYNAAEKLMAKELDSVIEKENEDGTVTYTAINTDGDVSTVTSSCSWQSSKDDAKSEAIHNVVRD